MQQKVVAALFNLGTRHGRSPALWYETLAATEDLIRPVAETPHSLTIEFSMPVLEQGRLSAVRA